MIKAIIFDCFGVLVTESWESFCQEYFSSDQEKLSMAHTVAGQLNSGQIGYDTFIDQVAELAGISSEKARDYIDKNICNAPLLDYIQSKLKSNYKIGMLSNAGDNWLSEMFTKEQLAIFDDVVLSYRVGITKPNAQIYELSAERLKVLATECVFIDDLEKHVSGAKAAGMQAIVYHDFAQMKTELEKILATG